jgi:hypothetical protein
MPRDTFCRAIRFCGEQVPILQSKLGNGHQTVAAPTQNCHPCACITSRKRQTRLIALACPSACPTMDGAPMAQLVVSWPICNGRLRVHAINAVGRRSGRIIEIEDIDTGERVHGSARRLERLVQTLRGSGGELDQVSLETPGRTS